MRRREGLALAVLAVQLMIVEPMGLAFYASSIVPRVFDRGGWAVLVLAARLAATAFGVGAGMALWNRRPGRVRLARAALAALAATVALSLLTAALPLKNPPGTSLPLTLALVAYYLAWFLYLSAGRRLERF
jgi:hypothetical protein